jgi:DnaJ family protein C protein 7
VEQAVKEKRRLARPDYYALLAVPKVASEVEIKHAYKQRALEVHPDRHAGKDPAEIAAMAERFKLLGEALELLADPMKRKLYDEGFDKAAIMERVEAAERAARDPHGRRGGGGGGGGHHHHH